MHKTSISIVSQEGRQKIVPWEFSKVISPKVYSHQILLEQTRMPSICKIVEYAAHHNYNNQVPVLNSPLEACDMSEIVRNDWDCKFFNSLNVESLVEIINTCEYLEFKRLSVYCQAYLSVLFKTLNIEELKDAFQVDDEFEEEKAKNDLELFFKESE
jgi:hypothetical protein